MSLIALKELAIDETLDRAAMDSVYGGFSWKRFGIGVGIAVGGLALAATGYGLLGIGLMVALEGPAAALIVPAIGLGVFGGGLATFGWGGFRMARALSN